MFGSLEVKDIQDLRNQDQVSHFFSNEKPDYVFLAAAKVGGIVANNTYPADFIRDNLMIQNNIIDHRFTMELFILSLHRNL